MTRLIRLKVRRQSRPARCPEPLCPFKVLPLRRLHLLLPKPALPGSHRSYGLMRQSKTLPPISVVPNTVGLCRLSPVPAGSWTFPALSLQSLYRCLDPYPVAPLRCICSLLLGRQRPHHRDQKFGTLNDRRNTTSTARTFRDCSHSVIFRLHT